MKRLRLLIAIVGLICYAGSARASEPLLGDDGQLGESVMEALLYPGDFGHKRFVYISEGEEAQYCLDSSLSAEKPFAQVYPERIGWPQIGGVDIRVETLDLKLVPEDDGVTDEDLDRGYAIRWFLEAVGQDFSNAPVFLLRAVGAEVFSTATARVLMHWQKPPKKATCGPAENGFPNCDLKDIPLATQSVAIDPLGTRAAIATTGRKPGVVMYHLGAQPKKSWQILFPAGSGGARDVTFTSDGEYVVALLANGEIHRFDASSGGRHLVIPSSGLVAHTVPPGDVVAVGGNNGEVILWRLADGTIEWKMEGRQFRGDIDKMAVSGDGKVLATLEYASSETIIRVYRIKEKKAVAQLNLDGTEYGDLALNTTGDTLLLTHETRGLLQAKVQNSNSPTSLGKEAVACTGEIFWAPQQDGPSCSVAGGILVLSPNGAVHTRRRIHSEAARWLIDQSPAGITVATGAGHLLVWK